MYVTAQRSSVTTPQLTQQTMTNPHLIETTPFEELLFTVVDVETNGSRPLFNQIIEIGIVTMQNGKVLDTYQSFINPGTPIPPDITMITGITDKDVEDAPTFDLIAPKISSYVTNGIFVAHNVQFDYNFIQKSLYRSGIDWHAPKLCTVQLSRKILPQLPRHNLDALAHFFHIPIENRHRALDDAKATGHALWEMCTILKQRGQSFLHSLVKSATPATVTKYKHLESTIKALPYTPGVYLMKDQNNQIIYVGKSKCLHKRVRSYFYEQSADTRKLERLVETVHAIDYIQTGSELSALLLESQKIKEHLPVFNHMIRNYKAYPFLKFTNEPYPRLIITREVKSDGATYYGPFKSTLEVKKIVDQLQKTFGIRPCTAKLNPLKPTSFKPCLDVALGNCSGACTGKLSRSEYAENIHRAQQFIDGNAHALISKLEKQIDEAAKELQFEKAAELRDKLITLERLHDNRAKVAQAIHQNNLIIVQPGISDKTRELFFIRNGILISKQQVNTTPSFRYSHDSTDSDTSLFEEETYLEPIQQNNTAWQTFLDNIYADKSSMPSSLTKQNLDELMIISTYLMQHPVSPNYYYLNSPDKIPEVAQILARQFNYSSDL